MEKFRAELHIHSNISPCASQDNTPESIFRESQKKGIKMVALTDHNSGENAEKFLELAPLFGIFALPGMEIETREEIHILGFFPNLTSLIKMQNIVYESLGLLSSEKFQDQKGRDGDQFKKILSLPTDLSLEKAVEQVRSLGGLVIPAHIDRDYKGLIAGLGKIPRDIPFDALEVTKNCDLSSLYAEFPDAKGFPILRGGDAHFPGEILGANIFHLEKPSIEEISLALQGKGNRRIELNQEI